MEKLPIKPERSFFKTILSHRKLLAGVGFIGGLFVLKSSGCLEGKGKESDLPEPTKAVQPAKNTSQTKAREDLKNLKIPAFKKEEEKVHEVDPSDNVGFGGTDPEDEKGGEKNPDKDKKKAAKNLLNLPHEELRETMQGTGFDELYELKEYLNAVASLRDAIRYGAKEDIEKEALEALRINSFWDAKESEFHKKYIEIRRKILRQPNGRKKMEFIKKILVATHQYIKNLATL